MFDVRFGAFTDEFSATQPGSATMVMSIDGSPSKAAVLPVGAAF